MKCLVVVSHPAEDSLCHYLAAQTVEHLSSNGYQITFVDLYKNNFEPVLTQHERRNYYQADINDDLLENEIEQLKQAEYLVLVFPTWWFGFPAILKGWFDRVWVPGHAYNHASDSGNIAPLLVNLKKVKVITTLGSPWWVDKLVLRQPVKRVLKTALLGACTKRCKFKMLSLYKSENASKQQIEYFIRKIKRRF